MSVPDRRPPREPAVSRTPISRSIVDRGGRGSQPPHDERPLAIAPSTKQQLVLTAERLFALRGIDGVSLRQISAEAGTANNSAVQYHFGSKERLIQAIFEYRIPLLTRRRQVLMAEASSNGRAHDLRACVEAYLLPLVEEAEIEDSYYLSFLMQLQQYPMDVHPFERMPEAVRAPTREFVDRVSEFLVDVVASLRRVRIELAISIVLYASAERERRRRRGGNMLPYSVYVTDLFDSVVGFLQAPSSVPRSALDGVRG